jgi:hypothetical protein
MDLRANEWTTFWKVTFPLILPGIVAATLLAFSLSIDDYVITSFTAGTTQTFRSSSTARSSADPRPGQRHRHVYRDRGRPGGAQHALAASRGGSRVRCHSGLTRPGRRSLDGRRPPTLRPALPPVPPTMRSSRPCGAHHQPRRGSRRGLVADTARDGERHLDYSSGIKGVTNTGHAKSTCRRGHPGAGREAAPRPAEHPLPRAGSAALRPAEDCPARRAVAGVPLELGRRGGGSLGQARQGRHGPAGDPRVPRRVPRPDGADDGAHDRQGHVSRGVRAAAGQHLPHAVPVLLPRGRRAA